MRRGEGGARGALPGPRHQKEAARNEAERPHDRAGSRSSACRGATRGPALSTALPTDDSPCRSRSSSSSFFCFFSLA